jgi:hypothetical protein
VPVVRDPPDGPGHGSGAGYASVILSRSGSR